jgi:hypothetical protein
VKTQASAGKKITDPFLVALADREELVRSGKLTTIIYIRTANGKGQEVSAYIDYAQRLKTDNFERYFDEVRAFAMSVMVPTTLINCAYVCNCCLLACSLFVLSQKNHFLRRPWGKRGPRSSPSLRT